MTFRLFDHPEAEPSQFVGFAGNIIDRQSEKRSDAAVDEALADEAAALYVMAHGRLFLTFGENGAQALFPPSMAAMLGARMEDAIYLGRDRGGPVIAVPSSTAPEELPEPVKAVDYRSVYVQGLLPPDQMGALAQGAALIAWNANHRFCGRCGSATAMRAGGYKRVCPSCGAEHFPRTDPVAIMLTVKGDECLLARSPHFAPNMYSSLAGFIEPGETIENAVRRETFEEAGIRVGRVAYYASQPWPFPYSLMIGCHAEALTAEITLDGNELEDGRWFGRGEVLAMIARSHPEGLMIPPPGAIASHLIQSWAESA